MDILYVSLGSTAGLRAADAELVASLRRAGASVVVAPARPRRDVRTLALTDLAWALAARAAARDALRARSPRAVVYGTVTAALLGPVPGAIRYDAPAAANRPGRHGVWQRPRERAVIARAPLLIPQAARAPAETPAPGASAALPLARALDPRLVTEDLARALRSALDDPSPGYAERAGAAIAPFRRAAVDRTVAEELLPRLLSPGG